MRDTLWRIRRSTAWAKLKRLKSFMRCVLGIAFLLLLLLLFAAAINGIAEQFGRAVGRGISESIR